MRKLLLLLFSGIGLVTLAQKPRPTLSIHKTQEKIKVDGLLDEDVWKNSERTGDFYISTPIDTAYAQSKTEVMMTYDDKNIYVAAI
ncbi:MAG: hydrolase, partial [Bacteroidia bacterium]